MPTEMMDEGRVRLLRHRANLLDARERRSPGDVVRLLVGLQAQVPAAPSLAIRARSAGLTAEDVDRALLEERSIVRTWAMRGTLHLITAEDFPWLLPLTAERQLAGAYRLLAEEGLPAERAERAVELMERMLAAEGPRSAGEIVDRLAGHGIRVEGQGRPHLLRLAALRGIVCQGPRRAGAPTFVLVRDWLAPDPGPPDLLAPAELAIRYLRSHAPAAPEDLAAWSGLRVSDARRAWEAVGRRLTEVDAGGRRLWTLGGSTQALRRGAVRLVPEFDSYLLGWKSRSWALPAEHEREIFPGGGIIRPAVLLDGRVVGTWSTARGKDPAASLRLFEPVPDRARQAVDREVGDVVRFRAGREPSRS
ncbi:MAG: AlkZ family DNA glycosylase [Actinobacteria bacterium]|nr:AlkZ family DNA glycosylase [Actinomycetota bacterium]